MSLHGTYDPQNVFAQIIRGEAPCYKLYEDDDVLAFLDLFPQSFGHPGEAVITSHAPSEAIMVSSTLVPVMDGFHANA